jgi:hypothetical protein
VNEPRPGSFIFGLFRAIPQRTVFILIPLRGNTKSPLNSGENTIFHLGFLNLSGYV